MKTQDTKDFKQTALANAAKALKTLAASKNSLFIPKVKAAQ